MRWFHHLLLTVFSLTALHAAHADTLSPEERIVHVLNRLAYGPRPGDVERVRTLGVDAYIDMQLHPETIPLPPALQQRLAGLDAAQMSASAAVAQYLAAQQAAKDAARQDDDAGKQQRRQAAQRMSEQVAEARLARAIESPRQLEEVMVDFWFNHFNIYAGKGLDRALVASYERDAIRPYVLGHFRDLLGATAHHPAMLFYLDNWLSAAPGTQPQRGNNAARASGLNENYAREVMELHTLGVDGGYTQKDVTELARMLTGWTFAPREMARVGGGFRFDGKRHDNGEKDWLGHHVLPAGRNEGEWALDVLAQHPATAHHIGRELAQYFVTDQPPPALVERLAQRYLETRGDIRAVLATLFASPEFWDPRHAGTKFKTPYQYVVSTARAAGADVVNVRPLLGTLAQLGMPLYGCQTPDGYKNTEDAWLNPDALTRRINFATTFAAGKLPLAKPAEAFAQDGMGMGKRQLERAALPAESNRWTGAPVDADRLLETLAAGISARTRAAVVKSEPSLRAALVLGSPDFVRH